MSISGRTINRTLNLTFKIVGLEGKTNELQSLATTLSLIIRLYITARIVMMAYDAAQKAMFFSGFGATMPWGLVMMAIASAGTLAFSLYNEAKLGGN